MHKVATRPLRDMFSNVTAFLFLLSASGEKLQCIFPQSFPIHDMAQEEPSAKVNAVAADVEQKQQIISYPLGLCMQICGHHRAITDLGACHLF